MSLDDKRSAVQMQFLKRAASAEQLYLSISLQVNVLLISSILLTKTN